MQWQAADSQQTAPADQAPEVSPLRDSDPTSPLPDASSPQPREQSPASKSEQDILDEDDETLSKDPASVAGDGQVWESLDASMQAALKARGLRAVVSQEKGRSLVATRPFKPGDIILEQEPLAWALFPRGQQASKWAEEAASPAASGAAGAASGQNLAETEIVGSYPSPQTCRLPHGIASEMASPMSSERCHFCLKVHENLRRCSACKYAHYCSAAHQKSDWPTHKADCARRARSDPARTPTPMVTMLAQISDMHRANSSRQPPLPPPAGRRLEDLYTLAAHYSAQPAERLTGYAQIVRLWAEYVGYSESSPPPEDEMRAGDLLHTLCRLACNCHTITDPDLRAVGVGIFPLAALVNHSCR